MQLKEIVVRPCTRQEQVRYHKLMQSHHYLDSAHPVSETLTIPVLLKNTGFSKAGGHSVQGMKLLD